MLKEVLEFASGVSPKRIFDGTFGRGGHTRAFLEAHPEASVTAIDQDVQAIEYGREKFKDEKRLTLYHQSFHAMKDFKHVPDEGFDLILLDLGVSSPQLDEAERGFSFYHDGPLDMRMNQTQELTASEVVNSWTEVELLELFQKYGEIRRPHRVVRAIVHDRESKPFTSTRQLSEMIERVEGWQKKGHHPATRYFLALRMAVNRELSGLEECLPDLMRALSKNGRLIVITFHSLEDRIIKYAFREAREWGEPLTKKVVIPTDEEMEKNPRARSAKLRVFQRGRHQDDSQKPTRDSTVL